jgi:glycosyltransferase involved in cell wall biosynthesis
VYEDVLSTSVRIQYLEMIPHMPADAASMRATRPPFGRSASGTVVGWVGRLDPVKRLEDTIKAFALFRETDPAAVLRVAATDCSYGSVNAQEYERRVHATVRALGIARWVELMINQEDIAGFLDGVDVFVSSSERETFSRSVFEAMMMERPIIATRAAAVSDLINDGVEGLLVEVGDVDAIAAGLQALMIDPGRARRLGIAAHARAARIAAEDPITKLEHVLWRVVPANPVEEV